MKRLLLATALASAAAFIGAGVAAVAFDAPSAEALTSGQVIGAYNVKFKGDGWAARIGPKAATPEDGYKVARVTGAGRLEITARDAGVNDGLVTVKILLDAATTKGLLGPATSGTPAFEGTAAVVGQSLAVIDAGQPNYVNALILHFDKPGRKLTGDWMAVFPALESGLATQKFATAVRVTVTGRRAQRVADGAASRR